jgi:hypothetical protein
MALETFSGVVVPLSAAASQQTLTEVALVPTAGVNDSILRLPLVPVVGDTFSTFTTVSLGFNTNPPPTTGIVYPLFR